MFKIYERQNVLPPVLKPHTHYSHIHPSCNNSHPPSHPPSDKGTKNSNRRWNRDDCKEHWAHWAEQWGHNTVGVRQCVFDQYVTGTTRASYSNAIASLADAVHASRTLTHYSILGASLACNTRYISTLTHCSVLGASLACSKQYTIYHLLLSWQC